MKITLSTANQAILFDIVQSRKYSISQVINAAFQLLKLQGQFLLWEKKNNAKAGKANQTKGEDLS